MFLSKLKVHLFSLGLAFAITSQAYALDVDLELVLAVDVSNSVDEVEAHWQHKGYTTAFLHPDVINAIKDGPHGRIAVTFIEWAGVDHQYQAIDWMIIDGQESAKLFVQRLISSPRTKGPCTSISALIDFSRKEFNNNSFNGFRQVIDISGDGFNSAGREVKNARNDAVSEGITINGLPVLSARPNKDGGVPTVGLDDYYKKNVIGGFDAFVIEANMLENFSVALIKKLVREIQGNQNLNIASY